MLRHSLMGWKRTGARGDEAELRRLLGSRGAPIDEASGAVELLSPQIVERALVLAPCR